MTTVHSDVMSHQWSYLEEVSKVAELLHQELTEKQQIQVDMEAIVSNDHLCGIHESLMKAIAMQDDRTRKIDCDVLRFRIDGVHRDAMATSSGDEVLQRLIIQGDLLRAIILCSKALLGRVEAVPSQKLEERSELVHTIQRAEVLLKILETRYADLFLRGTAQVVLESLQLPTNFPSLQASIGVSESITFDPQALAEEEEDLLAMAYTPTPDEQRGKRKRDSIKEQNASGRDKIQKPSFMRSKVHFEDDHSSPLDVEMDERGVIKVCGPKVLEPNALQQKWIITADSTIFFNRPMLRINNVLKLSENGMSIEMISLNVGADGDTWSEACLGIIERIKDSMSTENEVAAAWTPEVLEEALTNARKLIMLNSMARPLRVR